MDVPRNFELFFSNVLFTCSSFTIPASIISEYKDRQACPFDKTKDLNLSAEEE